MSIYWLQREEVPAEQNAVRRNTAPVDNFTPAAVQEYAPEIDDVKTDGNPQLGLTSTTLASYWHEPEQYAPFWQDQVDQQDEHNAIIDKQVSTSGTAAAREAAGQFGHGTMGYAIGIEPVQDLSPAGGLGNDYFVRNDRDIQEVAGNYMSVPPGYDQDTTGGVAAAGREDARKASDAAFQAFYSAVAG